jgi:hypothetical protein
MRKIGGVLLGLILVLGTMGVAQAAEVQEKVFVCKFVGTPGVNETLQAGDNPISVAVNAIPLFDPNDPANDSAADLVGKEFTDQQGRSLVLEVDTGQPDPPASACQPIGPPPPPPPPPPTTPTPPPVGACPGSVKLGPWYGDPRINIDLIGSGSFVVRGGIQRTTGIRRFEKTLACNEVFRIGRYKVERGHFLNITLNGVRVVHIKPPRLN